MPGDQTTKDASRQRPATKSGMWSADAEEREHTDHLRWLAEFDRWEAMSGRERDDEIRRAM